MSFSGGVYTLPGPALVTGEVVSATENNQFRNDVAGAFNLTMLRNGTSTATANLPMGGYKLTGLGAPSTNGDSLAYGAAAVVTTLTSTSLTATRVPYAGTGGLLQDASTFTFDGTTLTAGGFSTSGNISAATATVSGNITVSGGTANGVAYLNGSKVLTTGSALAFDGSNFLRVQGSSNTYLGITSGAGKVAYFGADTQGMTFELDGNNPIKWTLNGSEQMRLTSTGLGIGTSSPGEKLTVNGYVGFQNSGSQKWHVGADSSSNLSFVRSSVAERMVLTSDGNLGLGVTPSAWGGVRAFDIGSTGGMFDASNQFTTVYNAYFNGANWIYKTNQAAQQCQMNGGAFAWQIAPSGTAGNAISFTQAMTLDASGNLLIGRTATPSDGLARIAIAGSGDTAYQVTKSGVIAGRMMAVSTGLAFGVDGSDGATERMRIDSSGNLLVGTTSNAPAGTQAQFVNEWSGGAKWGASFNQTVSSATSYTHINFSTNGTTVGSINANNSSTSYATSSDYRLKENIHPMQNALAVVQQLNPVTYTWKADGSDGQGFIAHELQAVVPDCVTGEKDAVDAEGNPVYQGIDTSFLVATLTKAIQEQQEQINQLKAEVAALKGN